MICEAVPLVRLYLFSLCFIGEFRKMEKNSLELDEEEIKTLIEAIDYYHGDLLRKQYPTQEDNRTKQVLTNINNKICFLNQQN